MQVVHPRPQTSQEEPDAQPATLLLISLNLVFKFDIKEVHDHSWYRLSKNNFVSDLVQISFIS